MRDLGFASDAVLGYVPTPGVVDEVLAKLFEPYKGGGGGVGGGGGGVGGGGTGGGVVGGPGYLKAGLPQIERRKVKRDFKRKE